MGAQGQVEAGLLLHALAEPPQRGLPPEPENVLQFVKALAVKFGIEAGIEVFHLLQAGPGEIEGLVGHAADALLGRQILVNGGAL